MLRAYSKSQECRAHDQACLCRAGHMLADLGGTAQALSTNLSTFESSTSRAQGTPEPPVSSSSRVACRECDPRSCVTSLLSCTTGRSLSIRGGRRQFEALSIPRNRLDVPCSGWQRVVLIRSFLHRLCTLAPFPLTSKAASSKPIMHVLMPPFSREDGSISAWSYRNSESVVDV